MLKKVLFLFIVLILSTTNVFAREMSYLVVDMDTGQILYDENGDKLIYPASLTKLMTLYITFEALDQGMIKLDQNLIVSKTAAAQPASKIGFEVGEKITVEKCIEAVVVKSANDAAAVLSENISGDEGEFATMMTRVANEIGMKNTTFKNASGLNDEDQQTTAKDLALLSIAIKRYYPQYYKFFNLRDFKYKGNTIKGHNNILIKYPGADGLKTGYTKASGFNLIASAQNKNNQRILGIAIGFDNPYDRDDEMVKLLDYGFAKLNKETNLNYPQWKEDKTKRINSEIKENYIIKMENPNNFNSKINNFNKTTHLSDEDIADANKDIYTRNPNVNPNRNYIERVSNNTEPTNILKTSQNNSNNITKNTDSAGKYTSIVQIGAYSDRNKASLELSNISYYIPSNINVKNNIDETESNGKRVYRSQLLTKTKSDAIKLCNNIKAKGKTCFVK